MPSKWPSTVASAKTQNAAETKSQQGTQRRSEATVQRSNGFDDLAEQCLHGRVPTFLLLLQFRMTGQASAKVGDDDTCVSYCSSRSKAPCARSPQVPEHVLLLTTLVRDVEHHPLGKPLETLEGYVAPNRMLLERS